MLVFSLWACTSVFKKMAQNLLGCLFVCGLTLLLRWSELLTGCFKTAVVSRAVALRCVYVDPSLEGPSRCNKPPLLTTAANAVGLHFAVKRLVRFICLPVSYCVSLGMGRLMASIPNGLPVMFHREESGLFSSEGPIQPHSAVQGHGVRIGPHSLGPCELIARSCPSSGGPTAWNPKQGSPLPLGAAVEGD